MLTELKIRNFLVMAEELNFSAAAQRLYISQQALSAQIAAMEQDIGLPLFNRTTKEVSLTPVGKELAEFFSGMNEQLQSIIAPYQENANSLLRVSFFEVLDIGSPLFRSRTSLIESHPKIRCQISSQSNLMGMRKQLENDQVDVAVSPLVGKMKAPFDGMLLDDSPLYMFISPRHPDFEKISALEDVNNCAVFISADQKDVSRYLSHTFKENGQNVKLISESGSTYTLERMMVEDGECLGIGGKYSLLYNMPDLKRFPIGYSIPLYAFWKKNNRSPLVAAYVSTLVQQFEGESAVGIA